MYYGCDMHHMYIAMIGHSIYHTNHYSLKTLCNHSADVLFVQSAVQGDDI